MVFWTIAANSRHLATQFITQWVSASALELMSLTILKNGHAYTF